MISAPERRRSLGMLGDQLQRHEDGRLRNEPQGFEVLADQMKFDSLPQILSDLVQGATLSDDGDLKALGRVAGLFTRAYNSLNRPLKHLVPPSYSSILPQDPPALNARASPSLALSRPPARRFGPPAQRYTKEQFPFVGDVMGCAFQRTVQWRPRLKHGLESRWDHPVTGLMNLAA